MSGRILLKRLVILCTSGLLIIVLLSWTRSFSESSSPPPSQVLSAQLESPQIPTIVPAVPTRVKISALDVDAAIEVVALDEKGNMDVPKADENVGWYSLGYKPGEKGSSVLAGHLDTKEGTPAVFFNLHELESGETIQVTDNKGQVFTYIVESSQTYPYDQLPLQEVFASTEAVLRLITCKGTFDTTAENYSDRLVVTARLQSLE